tara:strand:- start:284 stop:532 length:249 start_codon:yes stop_codon:yes gene_type:complete
MKRLTLYQRLKPELKSNIKDRQLEYQHSVATIFEFLKEKENYIDLTINEINSVILFSDVRPDNIHEFANGSFAFKENRNYEE